MDTERTRCLIVGSGPAGYTAAIYAARANLAPVLYEGMEPGGQLTTTTKIENFPGFPDGILGAELMEAMKKQAQQLGVDIRFGIATGVDFSSSLHKVTIDGRKIVETDAVIIATGAQAKYLGLESETLFKGQGVSACATCMRTEDRKSCSASAMRCGIWPTGSPVRCPERSSWRPVA